MRTFYVTFKDNKSNKWFPIGKLTHDGHRFYFNYTEGSTRPEAFSRFLRMKDATTVYESKELFPFLSNRIIPKSRPEYSDLIKWMALNGDDPLDMLALSFGERQTDNFEIFPCPCPSDQNEYILSFFAHGISHMPEKAKDIVNSLKQGTRLFLAKDVQNPFDPNALLLRTDAPVHILGYVPRYFCSDFIEILKKNNPQDVVVSVLRVNPDAPFKFRLLCKIRAPWPKGFEPCKGTEFQDIPIRGNQAKNITSIEQR